MSGEVANQSSLPSHLITLGPTVAAGEAVKHRYIRKQYVWIIEIDPLLYAMTLSCLLFGALVRTIPK